MGRNIIANIERARNIANEKGGKCLSLELKDSRSKLQWQCKNNHKVNPRNTSKMCSNCHEVNFDLELKDRSWQCKHCQAEHDRDINAARNVLQIGQGLPEYEKALKDYAAKAA